MINIPKGTKDVLPSESHLWLYLEGVASRVAESYGARQIRTPVFEHTELFIRGVGETTDVVNKETYTFDDRGGRSITLKPEGTAGAVRSFIENGLFNGALPLKTYYFTPVFRYERPQAGRLREHHQFGVEIFGTQSPSADAELILLASSLFKALGIEGVKLFVNSIGCKKCRPNYSKALREYFEAKKDGLCPTCLSRLDRNPLRILDCKDDGCKKICEDAPRIADYLCDECEDHFGEFQSILRATGVEFDVDPKIVRGLDYYTKTVFEFVSDSLGAKSTVLGGGRYDGLVEELGGKPCPALGFGCGLERLLLTAQAKGCAMPEAKKPALFIACAGNAERAFALKTAEGLRRKGVYCDVDVSGRSFKAQFKYADKIGAKYVMAIGGDEMTSGRVRLKSMADGNEEEMTVLQAVGKISKEN